MNLSFPYRIYPLGDSALTLDFGNKVDEAVNKEVLTLFHNLKKLQLPEMIDIIPAYSSLSIFYNVPSLRKIIPGKITVYEWMKGRLEDFLNTAIVTDTETSRLISIPVCYDKEFGTDLDFISRLKNISTEDIIRLHTLTKYRVFMLGFLPGFPYMGITDNQIAVPRKKQPEQVMTGSVGIAGRQTGIYPMASPGGWQIIGRTALRLFEPDKEYVTLLKPGDMVEFYSISKEEYRKQLHEFENY